MLTFQADRYYAWYSDPGQTELIQRQLEWDLNGWFTKYNKPILVSEYGADTIPGMHHDPPFMVCLLAGGK